MRAHLDGKVAFVTGGARGIGGAIVRGLARDGAAAAFTYRGSTAKTVALAASIKEAGGQILAIQSDAGDATALTQAINQAASHFDKIDILVNNAGVLKFGPIDTLTLEDFDQTVDVNVRAVFVASQAVLPHMGAGGRIINIGSTKADRMPVTGGAIYAMSKSALKGLVQGMARDLGPRGTTVNNVQPGPVNTDMNPAESEYAKELHRMMALSRHAEADEIAGMVAYVASPEAGFVTGANLMIDGGFSA
ncbi:SDR family NAD(P)-dependent oxidoreductase [Dyella monticola]|uniref:SDR family NAD(P)-dependent oxidoreductase n=1 Tax=Dyella monticola TaxID=1927958 RepID=A0A370WSC3_9GAMM|nr:SDR family oxidoreductase [Dyella monticola]RDS79014.1 SDR family NAD(P)-dependent oxidoreductase [Dyella monticola]